MNHLFAIMVEGYRRMISPLFAGLGCGCRFHPTCSAYAAEALRLHPWPKATRLIVWRIMRCGPWCQGGFDPVEEPQRISS